MRIHRFGFALALIGVAYVCCATDPPAATPSGHEPMAPTSWGEGNYVVNLYDAFGTEQDGLTQDFGFSALVRYNGKTILFDSGSNADILKSNVEALGISLQDVDIAVASHAHFDHINGFDYLLSVNPSVTFYFPADFFWGQNVMFDATGPDPDAATDLPKDQRYFGGKKSKFMFNQSGRFWKANIKYVAEHTQIAPGLTLIATKSPYIGYFTRYPSIGGKKTEGAGDDIKKIHLPELSLNVESPNGDVLLVGCSHSLVESIVRATKQHINRPIGLVYGGYHLLPYKRDEIREMAGRLKDELGVTGVAPTHCTGHLGFKIFQEVFGDGYRVAGLGSTTRFP